MDASSRSGWTALALAVAVGVAGCGDPMGIDGGGVRFVLSAASTAAVVTEPSSAVLAGLAVDDASDSPATGYDWTHHDGGAFFVSANVTLSSVFARNYEGELIDASMALPVTVDVIQMESGREITLPDGDLPPGTYDQIVVVMTAVQGVTGDGTTVTIEPPGGGWTAVVPVCPFDVVDGSTTVVGLTLAVRRSFSWRDNRFHFDPHFECEAPEPDPEGESGP